MPALTIYCNADLSPTAASLLRAEVAPHTLLHPEGRTVGVLGQGARDPLVDLAHVIFGQPDVDQILNSPLLRWVQLSSAGYARYDRADLQQAFRARSVSLTKSSRVYDEACALHVLAFMCAEARQLGRALDSQRSDRAWQQATLRHRSRLLCDDRVVLVGFGAIARRLIELLAPLRMRLSAIRRTVAGDEPIDTYQMDDPRAKSALAEADHVVDILPDNPSTSRFFDARRFDTLKPGAVFYNIGRGTTVVEAALVAALESGRLSAAYLDVTSTEPLPPEHSLWRAPNCFITPHTAGGHHEENVRLVSHFLTNLRRFEAGEALLDRIV